MTKVVFETATIADAIKKAERVAPSKGTAFDKAAGIVMEINPDTSLVVVRATDLNIFSMEWVDTVSIDGEVTAWRLPSKLFATVLAGLPIGTGKNVTLEEKSNGRNRYIELSAGRTRAKFNLMAVDYFPVWEVFDPLGMNEVDDLGGRVAMVEWAAAKTGEPPLAGVHFTGDLVLATDQYKLAVAPLTVPGLTEPLTVPSGILGQILKQTGEVGVSISDDGHLEIMPDSSLQIRTVVYGLKYPDVERIMKYREKPNTVKVKKAAFLEILNRASAFSGNERFPILRLFFGREEIAVMMDTAEIGTLADIMEVPGYCDHARIEMKFGPRNIIESVEHCPNEELTIGYNPDNIMEILYIDGGSGYEVWVMPRKGLTPEEREQIKKDKLDASS